MGIVLLLILIPANVFAEHIFKNSDAFAQYLDIGQLSAEKYVLNVDEHSYDLYYGFKGSLEIDVENINENLPVVSSMKIISERKSLVINFSEVPETSVFWVRIPFEVMTAENERYQLFLDGKETPYDLTKFPSDYAVGMIIPTNTQQVEIIGTNVVPEFGAYSILILGLSVFAFVCFMQNSSFATKLTRIN